MVYLTTETGSKYVLDLNRKRWERTFSTPDSGVLRTHSGKFNEATYALGQPLVLNLPPFIAQAIGRRVVTSVVTKLDFSPEEGDNHAKSNAISNP